MADIKKDHLNYKKYKSDRFDFFFVCFIPSSWWIENEFEASDLSLLSPSAQGY